MQTITLKPQIDSARRTSRLFVGADILEETAALYDVRGYSNIFVLSDRTVAPILLDKLLHVLPDDATHFTIAPGERAKHIDTVQSIWKAMHRAGCDRKSLVINLGGGVVCDIGGFAASTYMRGIDFINIPTTLLAQVDASVGGKTGIDFDEVKNLVGTFSQPQAVIIDPAVLGSLPEREFVAGFAEIIKHGLIHSRRYLEQVTKKPPLEYTAQELEQIIAGSCRIKAEIVERDTTEGGLRKVVNFGHTAGHAFESLSLGTAAPLLHGEAIAIGMVIEADLSYRKGLLSAVDAGLVSEYVHRAGLPVAAPRFPADQLLRRMRSDKKNLAGRIRFTLLKVIGEAVHDQEIDPEILREVLERHMEQRDSE